MSCLALTTDAWKRCDCKPCHEKRCAGIIAMLRTEDGMHRLADLMELDQGEVGKHNPEHASAVRARILEMAGAGTSIRQIAGEVGCHRRFVRRILNTAGVA